MSFDFNHKFWLSTKQDIAQLLKTQNVLKHKDPIEDPKITFQILSQMYILYAELVDKLGYLYRETYQVQKRDVIYKLAESAINRLMDLKNKLKQMELSEYVYLDQHLIERNLTPYDLLIWRSSFAYRRPLEIKSVLSEPKRYIRKSSKEILHAVTKIQSHERARKARQLRCALEYNKNSRGKYKEIKSSYIFSHKSDTWLLIPIKRTIFHSNFIKPSIMCQNAVANKNLQEDQAGGDNKMIEQQSKCASIIQRTWRKFKSKKQLKMKLSMKKSLYGMRKGRKLLNLQQHENNILEMYQKELKQIKLEEDYAKLKSDEQARLINKHKYQIMEDISDQIRDWFREFYEKTGDFHPFPDANKSGTALLLIDETMDLEEFKEYQKQQELSKEQLKMLKEKQKLQNEKEKEKNKKELLKEKKRQKKMRDAGIFDIENDMKTNKHVEKIEKIMSQFSTDWKNVDEYLNKQHEALTEWVTEDELAVIHRELRILVDNYMRIEYNLLKKAWCSDNKKKFKPLVSREKRKLHKTPSKKIRDSTGDRTVESLYEELKAAEIIDSYPVKVFEDYMGDFNLMADDLRNENNIITSNPSAADIKMAIQDILFGMGAFDVEKPKTLCLVGPANTGKRLLCNIIASELGAIVINLSPEKTFPFHENLKYFIHIVMKVAKAFQPTIIFIQDAHRIFWKNIPEDQLEIQPTLLKNALSNNILKSIGKKDKIMVVGTSNLPWSAKPKFTKIFQNILMIPESDYSTIFLLWLELFTQNVNNNCFEDCILSVLAKIFQKYNTGEIINNVAKYLNVERRLRLYTDPLKPNEFLEYFLSQVTPLLPPEEKVLERYRKWYNTTNKYRKYKKSPKSASKKK